MLRGRLATSKRNLRQRMAAVDLFCGVGGKTHGFINAGIPVVAGFDVDTTCKFAFETNNPGAKFHCRDVDTVSGIDVAALYPPSTIRILIGCAPCQPFSTYTRRYRTAKVASKRRDERWRLLSRFGKLVDEVRPDIVAAENVPQVSELKMDVYEEFVELLEALGYHVDSRVVRCADYGVPQSRERLVLLASRLGELRLEPPTHDVDTYVTVRDKIGHLPPITAGGPSSRRDPLHRSCALSPMNMRRIQATPLGGGWQDWPKDLLLACHKRKSGKTYPSVYGRMPWDGLAPTITTQCFGLGNGRFGHPEQHRAISLREAALLQTFPPGYRFVAPGEKVKYAVIGRHIGNAVPVDLATAIGRSIVAHVDLMDLRREPG